MTSEKKNHHPYNLVKDESGAVMVEFLICAPFLITIMLAVFYFADVSRFLTSTHQWMAVQTWRTVGAGKTGESNSFQFPASEFVPVNIGQQLQVQPPIIGLNSGGNKGRIAAMLIYSGAPNLIGQPFKVLEAPEDTYYRDKLFDPASLDGAGGGLIYRNESYTTPLLGIINNFVGNPSGENIAPPLTTLDAHYASKGSIMNDPYSVFWGNDAINRIRRVDRYTTVRNPLYSIAYLAHTIVSGGLNIVGDLPQIMQDAGASGFGGGPGLSLPGNFEHAQPFRKVDKRINESAHDVSGQVSFGRGLADKNKLTAVSGDELWRLVQ
ncbi:pilus assembly protein [Candidatus Sumerlaeota bacterium]|nr:pilus assembly protein [Candidatus Sumerlaeota bacterium]